MVHAVSAAYVRFERMSPSAMGLAVLLHASVAWALWSASPLKSPDTDREEAIEVTIEQPSPEPPAPPPAAQQQEQATPAPTPAPPPAAPPPAPKVPPITLGLPPPAPATADKPQQGPQKQEPQKEQAAAQPPPPPPPPAPELEKMLPPIDAPPAPVTSRDFPKPPPPPQPAPPKPAQRPAPPQQQEAVRPSPLPHGTQPNTPQPGPSTTFVNPADEAARNRVADQYLWQVVRKFSQYFPDLRAKDAVGVVYIRFTVARDGRLLESSIAKSSGSTVLDKAVLDTVRAAAPYAPLPPDIPGDRATFTVPIGSQYRR